MIKLSLGEWALIISLYIWILYMSVTECVTWLCYN